MADSQTTVPSRETEPPPACSLPDCSRPIKRHGYCYRHYMKWWRYGDPAWTQPKRRRDLTGERFGLLVVIKELDPSHWLCRCECGNETRVRGSSLTSGGTVTCNQTEAKHRRAEWVDYSGAHSRVRYDKGPASAHRCVDCGGPAAEWSYDHSDPNELHSDKGYAYSLDSDHYQPRCAQCHRTFDWSRKDAASGGDADGA